MLTRRAALSSWKHRAAARGLSMIEIMIGIAVAAMLMLLGVPEFTSWLNNAQLRTAAESLSSGLKVARAEALQRNTQVEFILTTSDPIAANVAAAAADTAGKNWMVRYDTDPDPGTTTYAFLQGKSGSEGGPNALVTAPTATVVFTGLGRTTLAASATFQITNPTAGLCVAAGGPMRCLNVVVSTGGQIKMCDPAVTAAGDTRAC